MMKHSGAIVFLSFASLVTIFTMTTLPQKSAYSAKNDEIYDNKAIRAFLGNDDWDRPVKYMKDNEKNITRLLEDFLEGDLSKVSKRAGQIRTSLLKIREILPQAKEEHSKGYEYIMQLIADIDAMDEAAKNDKYIEAFKSYNAVTASCISCHQTFREYGVFGGIEERSKKAEEPTVTTVISSKSFGDSSGTDF